MMRDAVLIALGTVCVLSVPAFSQNVEAQLMGGGESLSGEKTFCVEIKLEPSPAYEPAVYLNAGFAENNKGYFEVDGNRIKSWAGQGAMGSYVNQSFKPKRNGIYKITLGVISTTPVKVAEFKLSGAPLTSIKEMSCPASSSKGAEKK